MAASILTPAIQDECDEELKKIISSLYMLIVAAHDHQGQATQHSIATEIKHLLTSLVQLSKSARRLPTYIPIDIIQYVELSRNPDIYTREFVELIMRYNQQLKGQSEAFAAFRDILGREMYSAMPEIQTEVAQVVEATGGKLEQ